MVEDTACSSKRTTYGFVIVLAGLLVVTVVFVASLMKFGTVSDVTAVLGAVTGLIGTIIGAFFGIQVGAEGKTREMEARNKAEDFARELAGRVSPTDYQTIKNEIER